MALGGWSESEADGGGGIGITKLWSDGDSGHSENWVLYEDLPEDGEGAFEICQSEDGAVGLVTEMHAGTVCHTKDGAKDSFYVLYVPDQDDQEEVEEDEGETGGLARKLQKKVRDRHSEESVRTGMMPDFDWSGDEMTEIQEALEATDAWQRFLDEGPELMGAEGAHETDDWGTSK